MKIAYITPSLYIAGGVERVLTTKVNYFADELGYDVTIILTDGLGREPYFPLSSKVKVINLNIGFEAMWQMSFIQKGLFFLRKQRQYKKALRQTLMNIRPDITISTGRREVDFLCNIPDGSRKICEIHVNRSHYRNFEGSNSNPIKEVFARFWMRSLVRTLRRFDRVVCLTPTDAAAWHELKNVTDIPNPLPPTSTTTATKDGKRVIAVGRYVYQKGFDMLIDAWATVMQKHPEWRLDIYGAGEREPYKYQVEALHIGDSCTLHDADPNITARYAESNILAVSSRFEGFGMIIIEAMAQGCVPVSFNCPYGPSDIITDGKDGWLVENGNTEALAKSLCHAIEHQDEWEEMAENAKATAQHYDVANIARRWTELFNVLCPEK